ncbi:hypothetical protein GGQ97_002721 [Sphingomonas kaistensis]|uniref:Tip attachment protein J domain-containing protein n=1 Tax=Sphingomonas kaistensis TaxID=298708 RepID=A0A7X5Y843_9SPHN|nr:phage tail protein [Sphingomonas kaistensis]NJC06928.1 hypothetical protein [Sphingomonas kaistensis]
MANLVLGAAGAALGGPVGGALGSMLGRQIDRSLGRVPSARLSDLRAPSSQYGDQIPSIVRSMRVAGVVNWTAQPVATATVSKSGSSQGSSVSFAYAISSGRVGQIGRIWADGRVIRDQEGRQEVSFEMRLHDGDEDQPSDPLIASILGDASAPAFRGIAYILFEDFDLSSFGNRLPFITVELLGTGEPIAAEQVLSSQLGIDGAIAAAEHLIEGCALTGDNLLSAIGPFCDAFEPSFAYADGEWSLGKAAIHHVIDDALWTLDHAAQSVVGVGGNDHPTKVSVRFFDPDLDFAAGEKSARFLGVERLKRIELPAALEGKHAKATAFERLASTRGKAHPAWLKLPLSYADVCVGDHVSSSRSPAQRFLVCTKELASGELKFGLRRQAASIASEEADAGGRRLAGALGREPLAVSVVEMPGLPGENEPEVAILVSGGHVPFQQLPLAISIDGVEQTSSSAPTACSRAVLLDPLPASAGELIDKRNAIRVEFDKDPFLTSCDESALLAGANLGWLDGEFIQFATAKHLGRARYELSGLIRGRFDSGVAVVHDSGSQFIMLAPTAFTTLKVSHANIGATFVAKVHGPDGTVAEATATIKGLAAKPWTPVHLSAADVADGLAVNWVRRCKEGAPWLDAVETPIGSSREAYRVRLTDQENVTLELETSTSSAVFAAQSLASLGARPWRLVIVQLGDFAASREAILTVK